MQTDHALLRRVLLNDNMGFINKKIISYYLNLREKIIAVHAKFTDYILINFGYFTNTLLLTVQKGCDYFLIGLMIGPMAKEDLIKSAKILNIDHRIIIYINALVITPVVCYLNYWIFHGLSWLLAIPQNDNIFSLTSHKISSLSSIISYLEPIAAFIWNSTIRPLVCHLSQGRRVPIVFGFQSIVQNCDVWLRYWISFF